MNAFLGHVAEERLAALYVLAATSGLRRSELLGLRWADLSLDGEPPVLHVRRALAQYGKLVTEKEPKTPRSRRTIVLDAGAVTALHRHRSRQAEEHLAAGEAYADDDRVFADEIGRALRPVNMSRAFARAAKGAGLPPIGLHGLRHSFATSGSRRGWTRCT